jgi:hypothetical protein
MPFLPKDKPQRIKMLVLITGCVVFVMVGYFRFFHKKSSAATARPSFHNPLSQLHVPQVDLSILQKAQISRRLVEEVLKGEIRNIFAPMTSAYAEPRSATEQLPDGEEPDLVLKGTIVGGGRPLAIIDDQFVSHGDWIDEYRVIRISKKGVLLDSGKYQIELEIVKNE